MNYESYFNSCIYDMANIQHPVPQKIDPVDELSAQFEKLKCELRSSGYITVGFFCKVMNCECENPYDIYCGNKDTWQKYMIQKLSHEADDPKKVKQIIDALGNMYDEEEE